jgi:hypothetical protein
MGAVSLTAWGRFWAWVVERAGRDWPPPLWLSAVEGLTRALAPDSSRLPEFRQYAACAKTGSDPEPHRVAQLDPDIKGLIGRTDQAIRKRAAQTKRQPELAPAPQGLRRERSGVWLGALALGVMLFCGVVLGATYYQTYRMAQRMERELTAFREWLIAQDAQQRAAFEVRIRSIDRVKQDLDQFQVELRANAAESGQSMAALGVAQPEKRLPIHNPEAKQDPAEDARSAEAQASSAKAQPPAPEFATETGADRPSSSANELSDAELSTVAPTAKPSEADRPAFTRFQANIDDLNDQALAAAGVEVFSDAESVGNRVVHVSTTVAWASIPPAGQQSYLNTLLNFWIVALGGEGPAVVRILDQDSRVLLEKSAQ